MHQHLFLTDALRDEAMKSILEPMVAAMEQEGMPYVGCLYAGLMITNEGPKVDWNLMHVLVIQKTQVVLPLLEGDFRSNHDGLCYWYIKGGYGEMERFLCSLCNTCIKGLS